MKLVYMCHSGFKNRGLNEIVDVFSAGVNENVDAFRAGQSQPFKFYYTEE